MNRKYFRQGRLLEVIDEDHAGGIVDLTEETPDVVPGGSVGSHHAGDDARRCWDDACNQSIPRRIALDGQAYTWTQCMEAYGDAARR